MKNIWKKKLRNFFLLLQFVFVIMYFFMTSASIQRAFNICIGVPKVLADRTTNLIHIEVQNDEMEIEDFEKLCESLRQRKITEEIVTYENSYFESKTFNDETIGNLRVQPEMKCIKEFQVQSGRNFSNEDRNKKIPPLIIGSKLADEYHLKVGDMIEESMTNKKYEIIGILKSNSFWFQQSVSEGLVLSLDRQVITLIPFDEKEVHQHYYCILKSTTSISKSIEQIDEVANQFNIILQGTPVEVELEQQYEKIWNENIHWFVFSVIIMIMIAIGTAMLAVAHTYSRRREMGIRLAVGYTPRKIFWLLAGEIIFIIFTAYGIASILGKYIIGNGIDIIDGSEMFTGYVFSWKIALFGGAAALVMCIPSVIALFIRVQKFQPGNLIGGKDE